MSFLYSLCTNSGSLKLLRFLQWHSLTAKEEWDAAAGCSAMILGTGRGAFAISKGAGSQTVLAPHPPSLPPFLLGVAKLSESWASHLSLSDPDMHSQLLWQPLEKQTVLLTQIALFPIPVPLAKSLPPTCCKDRLSSFLFEGPPPK